MNLKSRQLHIDDVEYIRSKTLGNVLGGFNYERILFHYHKMP